MQTTFGDPSPIPHPLPQSTRVVFRTEHFHLRWVHCSTTADFLADFYAGVQAQDRSDAQIKELRHGIGYLTNELVENAVKFRTTGDVEIEAGMENGDFLLRIANWIAPETSAQFQALLSELVAGDPGDLLIQRIEANAAGGSGSGLGLLTLMSDYGVRMTWNFQPAGSGDHRVHLETLARLPLPA